MAGLALQQRMHGVAARARVALSDIEKTIFPSPAGKKRIAHKLAKLLPPHSTYIEPFAGSAAVFFAKKACDVEVLNDGNPDIAHAYQTLKAMTSDDVGTLKAQDWIGSYDTFKKVKSMSPESDIERLYKFLYLRRFSFGKFGLTMDPWRVGRSSRVFHAIDRFGARLKNATICSGDYEEVVRKYDGPDAALFLDPPYPGYNGQVGEAEFDEDRFLALLKDIKGKCLITYGIRGKFPAAIKQMDGWVVKKIRPVRMNTGSLGNSVARRLEQLVVMNYDPQAKSVDGLDLEDLTPEEMAGIEPPVAMDTERVAKADEFSTVCRLLKGVDPQDERFVLGIVLEPETVDAQNDIYSAEEIRQAAHRFMEDFGDIGLQHQRLVNDKVKVLESYIAPVDFTVGGVDVKRGTWMLAVRVLDDAMWEAVKDGEITGFSIGGSARRVPEPDGAAPGAPEEAA